MMVLSVWMLLMMIPMKPVMMTMTMATISPLREGTFLIDFSLPESFYSLYGSAPEAAAIYFFEAFPMIFRLDRSYTQKGGTEGDPGPLGGP